ncbi:MAG: sulfotransferase family protein [Anaerolineae bacterium]
MSFLKKWFGKREPSVIVVSGLPRSGTSMMMKMLAEGGLDLVTDGIREANEDNPKGYYEFERVKKLPDGDTAWLPEARGKAVKVISALLLHLPDEYTYKVLFMRRHMEEILDSQRRMLIRRGEPTDRVDDGEMAEMFEKHLRKVYAWMDDQPNLDYLDVDYNALLRGDARPIIRRINAFIGGELDEQAMASVIDPNLYRQRAD